MTDQIQSRPPRLSLRRQASQNTSPSTTASTDQTNAPEGLKTGIEATPKPLHQNQITPSSVPSPLNHKQQLFVQHYLMSHNATDAAKKAGYSPKTAHVQGHELLKHPKISASISKKTNKVLEKLDMSRERIQLELVRMGLANMQDYMRVGPGGAPVTDFSDLTRDQAAALQEITVEEFTDGRSDKRQVRRVKFKLADKTAALMAIGKDLGMFKEQVTHDHRHTLVGVLLEEIDRDGRGAKVIEQMPQTKE